MGLHVRRWHQPGVMPELAQFPRPEMRARTGRHAEQARAQTGEEREKVDPLDLSAQNDPLRRITPGYLSTENGVDRGRATLCRGENGGGMLTECGGRRGNGACPRVRHTSGTRKSGGYKTEFTFRSDIRSGRRLVPAIGQVRWDGRGKPRSRSAVAAGRLPSRWACTISTAPVPQAMVRPCRIWPGWPWPSAHRQRKSFRRSVPARHQAPGKGERARIWQLISVAGRVQSMRDSALSILLA